MHKRESAYVNEDKLFAAAIRNVTVIQNAKLYELRTVIKQTFVQESGPATSR